MPVVIFDDRSTLATDTYLVDGINFIVALIFRNNTFAATNISFTVPVAADGKLLACTGGGVTSKKIIRLVYTGMSFENIQLCSMCIYVVGCACVCVGESRTKVAGSL